MPDPITPEDSDDEFELEAVDPEILEHGRRRAARQIRETETRAAQQELYEQPEASEPFTLDDFKGIRFTTKHLLIATAVLSIVMSVIKIGKCNGVFFTGLAALAGGWWWVLRKERIAAAEKRQRLEEVAARLAAHTNDDGEPIVAPKRPATTIPKPEEVLPEKPALSFSFSIKQIMGAMAVAAVMLTLARIMEPEGAALLLGLIAVIGLVFQIMGVELPGIVVFGWWILLVLYLVMSVWAIFFATPGGA
ncbi:hypothetical protein [Bythopirellula polymerisocia]|uniref:Transmembrane protein n=1 Tax=Bythopirellula polymerisocia TaxID=2528003 RepID=A0A5C6CGL5_9BACT|nr:hypothetical protein [Bythopirellula polymerisocia]TWU22694.1 hypothetical protein Pla144_41540 [Bythopirellula polymerisocia]